MAGESLTSNQPNHEHSFEKINEVSLRDLHELFIKYKQHAVGIASATIENYRINFRLLLQFKPDISLSDLTENTIIKFIEYLNTRERKVGTKFITKSYKNSSIATVRGKLNVFFIWLVERGYLSTSPFEKMDYPDVSYTDRRAFSPKEFQAICHAVNTKIKWQSLLIKKRNTAIVMLLVLTGLRKEELLGLQISDIDIERRLIVVRAETSKSKRTRIIPMNSELVPYLEDYLNYRKTYKTHFFWVSCTSDRGFTKHGAKNLVRQLRKVTQINCHLHRFRHTFATNYYKQSNDLVGLQKLMGHRNFKMTLNYLRSLPDDHLIEQIKKMTINEFI